MSSASTGSLQSLPQTPPCPAHSAPDSDANFDSCLRSVRFSERCVLIPQCSKRQPPRMGTLELPIPVGLPWRWPSSPPPKDKEFSSRIELSQRKEAPPTSTSAPEARQIMIKLPYPIFRRKSHSALQASIGCPPPCLVRRERPSSSSPRLRHSVSATLSTGISAFEQERPLGPGIPKKRSNSLPLPPLDQNVATVPLRPCCEKCLSGCDPHWKRLPTLQESSREHTPSQSCLNLHEANEEEDWCAGLHFTKGALRLRRSASEDHGSRHSQEGSGLLDSLVRVDEVDHKRGTTPIPSPRNSIASLKSSTLHLNTRDVDRIKNSTSPSPNRSLRGSDGSTAEDLFPLPSPKRSPVPSPSVSATYLPVQVPPAEPRRLEASIKSRMAVRERERAVAAAAATTAIPPPTSPIPSHFHSRLDEIVYDPTLPDPDVLPPTSTILLNSPPSSPTISPAEPERGRSRSRSRSSSSSRMYLPDILSLSPPHPKPSSAAEMNIPIPPIPAEELAPPSRPPNRRASISSIMRASIDVLRGINLGVTVPTTQTSSSMQEFRV